MPNHLSSIYIYQAAGDTYRSTYHSLTADPSSLSNLDQDLPNYLQHEVCPPARDWAYLAHCAQNTVLLCLLCSPCSPCALGAHPLAARGVALVRGLVRQRLARQGQDHRP